MGQLNSKEGAVPLKQTEQNLHWVLNENVKWSERAPQAMLLLGSGNARFHQDRDRTLDEQTTRNIADIDRLMAHAAASTAFRSDGAGGSGSSGLLSSSGAGSSLGMSSSSSDVTESRYGAGSNTDIFDPERPVALPLSHPAHQMLASQFFGAAATKEIVLAQNASAPSTHPAALAACEQPKQQASEEQLTEWTRGRLERVHTLSKMDPHGVNSGGVALGSLPPLMHQSSGSALSSGQNSAASSAANSPRRSSMSSATLPVEERGSQSTLLSTAQSTNPHLPLNAGLDQHLAYNSTTAPPRPLTDEETRAARDNYKAPTMYDTVPAAGQATYPVGTGLAGVPHSATADLQAVQHNPNSTTVPGVVLPASDALSDPSSDLSPNSGSGTGSSMALKERVELVTKYLYVHALLDKMIASAQTSFQIALHMESLRKQLKPKRTRGMSASAIAVLQQSFDEKRQILRDNMELFDKSRLTLQWFKHDFNLCFCLHLLHDTEVVTRTQRDHFQQEYLQIQQREAQQAQQSGLAPVEVDDAQRGVANYNTYGSAPVSAAAHRADTIARLDRVLAGLETRRAQIELRLQANERTALSIAHYYLSRHSNGAGLSITDAPELPSAYFSMLDLSHTQRVTREGLQVTLCRLAETLDSLNARIQALQMHNESMADGSHATAAAVGAAQPSGQSSNMQKSNARKIEKLQQEQLHTAQALRGISNFFLNVFVSNIFVNIGYAAVRGALEEQAAVAAADPAHSLGKPVLGSEDINPNALLTDLNALSNTKTQVLNPLDVANEGVVGPDERVASQVATGLPVDRTATTVDPERAASIVREHESATGAKPAASSPARYGSTIAARLARLKEIEAANLHPAPHAAQQPVEIHDLLEKEQKVAPQALVVESSPESATRPSTSRQSTDLTMLTSRSRKALPTPPSNRAASLPIQSGAVARNAALAPAVQPADLQQAQLAHVPDSAIKPSIYGGQHDRSMIPGAVGDVPADGTAINAALAPVVDEGALASQGAHLAHVPLTEANVTDFGGITMHPGVFAGEQQLQQAPVASIDEEQKEAIIAGQKPIDAMPAAAVAAAGSLSGGGINALPTGVLAEQSRLENEAVLSAPTPIAAPQKTLESNPVWSEPHSLTEAAETIVAPSAQHQPTTLVMDAPPVLVAPQSLPNEVPATIGANAALAPLVSAKELKAEKKALEHVHPSEQVASDVTGSTHMAGAALPPSHASLVQAQEGLSHVDLSKAPVTASGGVHLIAQPDLRPVPSQAASSEAHHATLAPVVREADLKAQHDALEKVDVSHVQPSQYGGVHQDGAQVDTIDRVALQYVKAHQLHHVPIDKAATSASGGIHMIAQPELEQGKVPEQAFIPPDQSISSNAALAPTIRPEELQVQRAHLDSTEAHHHLQPSRYGGVHAEGAQTGVVADPVALQFVKEHELSHVPIEKAPVTASGGVHLIAQPDTTRVPEAAAAPEGLPINAALAGAVSPTALRYERRSLEHVPLERQVPTASGGVHMGDSAATVPLTLMDRVKSVLGLETSAEQKAATAPIEGLGRVVDRVPVKVEAHTVDSVSEAAAASAPVSSGMASPSTDLVFAANKGLAPLIGTVDLVSEKLKLHHVPLQRLELKRDLAAGVGQVTTRRATPRHQLRGSIVGQRLAGAEEDDLLHLDAASSSAPASAVPSPRNRLPLVTAGRAASASNSPRGSVLLQQQPRAAIVEVAPAVTVLTAPVVDSKLPASDALTKELWSEGTSQSEKEAPLALAPAGMEDKIGAQVERQQFERPIHHAKQQ